MLERLNQLAFLALLTNNFTVSAAYFIFFKLRYKHILLAMYNVSIAPL